MTSSRRRQPRPTVMLGAAMFCSVAAACTSLGGLAGNDVADAGGDAMMTPADDAADATPPLPDAATADADADAKPAPCPEGKGPPMLRTPHGCIDATEVTQKQYAAFLASPTPPVQPVECAFNTTFVPGQQANGFVCSPGLYDPVGRPEAPVRCVDWCDARTFCVWAGKRLCGKIGGGTLAGSEFADGTKSEWMAACSNDGTRAYPYGPTYTPAACHDTAGGLIDPAAVASAPSCIGGFPGLFDMSGNVAEWEDACDATACHLRGGDTRTLATTGLACDSAATAPRASMGGASGFRCCAD